MDEMNDAARRQAVTDAYAAHSDDVYRLAYAILHDRDDAVDVAQDVFMRAFEQWHRYDHERPLRPWLHTITSRLALDRLRRRRVRRLAIPALARDAARRSGGDDTGDPATTIHRRERLKAALAALQPVPRAAVLLRHRYGYDYAEIGAILGLSNSNVGAVLSRARAALRVRLSDDAPSAGREEEHA